MFPSFPTLVITDLVFPFITTNTLLLDTHLHTKEKTAKLLIRIRCAKKANLYKGNYQGHEGAREQPKRQLKCLDAV